jgi:hypothetical protein
MRRILIATTLAFALLGTGVASAAFRSGFYSGRTQFGGPASFSATQSKLRYLRIGVVFNCTDGDRFQTLLRGFPAQNIVKVTSRGVTRGRYGATFTGSNGASTYTHRGSILNRTANGTFTGVRRYDENDRLDPNGTVLCRTGLIRYTIRRPA